MHTQNSSGSQHLSQRWRYTVKTHTKNINFVVVCVFGLSNVWANEPTTTTTTNNTIKIRCGALASRSISVPHATRALIAQHQQPQKGVVAVSAVVAVPAGRFRRCFARVLTLTYKTESCRFSSSALQIRVVDGGFCFLYAKKKTKPIARYVRRARGILLID